MTLADGPRRPNPCNAHQLGEVTIKPLTAAATLAGWAVIGAGFAYAARQDIRRGALIGAAIPVALWALAGVTEAVT